MNDKVNLMAFDQHFECCRGNSIIILLQSRNVQEMVLFDENLPTKFMHTQTIISNFHKGFLLFVRHIQFKLDNYSQVHIF